MNYFPDEELACRCCGKLNFNSGFKTVLNLIREDLGEAMIVNSGCRCEQHNRNVGGVENSDHLITETKECTAIDIKCMNDGLRWTIIMLAVKYGIRIIWCYPTFLHLSFNQNRQQGRFGIGKI